MARRDTAAKFEEELTQLLAGSHYSWRGVQVQGSLVLHQKTRIACTDERGGILRWAGRVLGREGFTS